MKTAMKPDWTRLTLDTAVIVALLFGAIYVMSSEAAVNQFESGVLVSESPAPVTVSTTP